MRKTLIAVGAAVAVLLSGAVAVLGGQSAGASGMDPTYVPEGKTLAITPIRVMDTRASGFTLAPGEVRRVCLPRAAGFANGSTMTSQGIAVLANVTAVNPQSAGYLTVWAIGDPRPVTSNLNFAAGQTVANMALTKVGAYGAYQSDPTIDRTGCSAAWSLTDPNGVFGGAWVYNGSAGRVDVLVDVAAIIT